MGTQKAKVMDGAPVEKPKSKPVSSSKKKTKRIIVKAIAHVKATFNNTIISITASNSGIIIKVPDQEENHKKKLLTVAVAYKHGRLTPGTRVRIEARKHNKDDSYTEATILDEKTQGWKTMYPSCIAMKRDDGYNNGDRNWWVSIFATNPIEILGQDKNYIHSRFEIKNSRKEGKEMAGIRKAIIDAYPENTEDANLVQIEMGEKIPDDFIGNTFISEHKDEVLKEANRLKDEREKITRNHATA